MSGAANIIRGSTAQVTVTVARMAYYTGSIDLSVEALPTGVTAAFLPTTVPASSTTSTLTLSATTTAALGTATATVRARGVGVTDATIQIVMNVSQ